MFGVGVLPSRRPFETRVADMKTPILAVVIVALAVLVAVTCFGLLVISLPFLAVYAVWSAVARAIRAERAASLERRVSELQEQVRDRDRHILTFTKAMGGRREKLVWDWNMN
jgi:hypothetical protein